MNNFTTSHAPEAIWPYSKSYRAWNLIFCSGQIPLVSSTMELIDWWIEDQTRQVCRNLWEVLKEHWLWLKVWAVQAKSWYKMHSIILTF